MLTFFIIYFTGVLIIYFLMLIVQTEQVIMSQKYFIRAWGIDPEVTELYLADGSSIELYTNENGYTEWYKLVTVMYFAMTTLTTVGYGDLFPISNVDKIIIMVL